MYLNMLWSKSKALRKSKSTILTVDAVPSVACSQWWNIEISASVVDEPAMNPNMTGSITGNSAGFNARSIMKLSATFERVDLGIYWS